MNGQESLSHPQNIAEKLTRIVALSQEITTKQQQLSEEIQTVTAALARMLTGTNATPHLNQAIHYTQPPSVEQPTRSTVAEQILDLVVSQRKIVGQFPIEIYEESVTTLEHILLSGLHNPENIFSQERPARRAEAIMILLLLQEEAEHHKNIEELQAQTGYSMSTVNQALSSAKAWLSGSHFTLEKDAKAGTVVLKRVHEHKIILEDTDELERCDEFMRTQSEQRGYVCNTEHPTILLPPPLQAIVSSCLTAQSQGATQLPTQQLDSFFDQLDGFSVYDFKKRMSGMRFDVASEIFIFEKSE